MVKVSLAKSISSILGMKLVSRIKIIPVLTCVSSQAIMLE
jgi:hypothetical protein